MAIDVQTMKAQYDSIDFSKVSNEVSKEAEEFKQETENFSDQEFADIYADNWEQFMGIIREQYPDAIQQKSGGKTQSTSKGSKSSGGAKKQSSAKTSKSYEAGSKSGFDFTDQMKRIGQFNSKPGKSPVKKWKQNPGDYQFAFNAAYSYAIRQNQPVYAIQGNSYMKKVYHLSFGKGLRSFMKGDPIYAVDPNGTIYRGIISEDFGVEKIPEDIDNAEATKSSSGGKTRSTSKGSKSSGGSRKGRTKQKFRNGDFVKITDQSGDTNAYVVVRKVKDATTEKYELKSVNGAPAGPVPAKDLERTTKQAFQKGKKIAKEAQKEFQKGQKQAAKSPIQTSKKQPEAGKVEEGKGALIVNPEQEMISQDGVRFIVKHQAGIVEKKGQQMSTVVIGQTSNPVKVDVKTQNLIPAKVELVNNQMDAGKGEDKSKMYRVKQAMTKKQREAKDHFVDKPEPYQLLQRFYNFTNKEKTTKNIRDLYRAMMKYSSLKQQHRSDNYEEYFKEALNAITKLYNQATKSNKDTFILQINNDLKQGIEKVLKEGIVAPSAQHVRSYINLLGQKEINDKDNKLLKAIERDLKSRAVGPKDLNYKLVLEIRKHLINQNAPYPVIESLRGLNGTKQKAKGKKKGLNGPADTGLPDKPKSNGHGHNKGLPAGIVSAKEFANQDFSSHEVPKPFKGFLNELPEGANFMVYGLPKHGKTSFTIQLAKQLTGLGPVLYDFAEQKLSATTQTLIKQLNADQCDELYLAQVTELDQLKQALDSGYFSFVVIDLIRDLDVEPEQFKAFMDRYPQVSFILVFSSTKTGNFKGGQDWMHDTDCIVEVLDYMAYSSGRLGQGQYTVWNKGAKDRQKAKEKEKAK